MQPVWRNKNQNNCLQNINCHKCTQIRSLSIELIATKEKFILNVIFAKCRDISYVIRTDRK